MQSLTGSTAMRSSLGLAALAVVISIALPAFFAIPALYLIWAPKQPKAGATVIVQMDGGGHGSGFHIGNGYILTAAHVANGSKSLTLKTDTGEKLKASVLWSNADYDVALLRMANVKALKSIPLSCRTPQTGEAVSIEGNPSILEFVTTYGRISGKTRDASPTWKAVYVVDITIAPGVSGGPVIDASGSVVGIAVGILAMAVSPFSVIAPAYSFIVPSRQVCNLMGRA
jgi:S1-C subfamily serine protease